MAAPGRPPRLYLPALYEILVLGEIGRGRADWFPGLAAARIEAGGCTIVKLSGIIPDQSALLGHLTRLHNLGCTIMAVRHLGFDG